MRSAAGPTFKEKETTTIEGGNQKGVKLCEKYPPKAYLQFPWNAYIEVGHTVRKTSIFENAWITYSPSAGTHLASLHLKLYTTEISRKVLQCVLYVPLGTVHTIYLSGDSIYSRAAHCVKAALSAANLQWCPFFLSPHFFLLSSAIANSNYYSLSSFTWFMKQILCKEALKFCKI